MNTKRIISAALSAALLIPSTIGLASTSPINASAASYSAGTVWQMSIPDSQININSEYKIHGGGKTIELIPRIENNWRYDQQSQTYSSPAGKSKSWLKYTFTTYELNRQTVNYVLTVPSNNETDTAEKIKEHISFSGSNNNTICDYIVEKDTRKSNSQTAVYVIRGSFITYYGEAWVNLNFDSLFKDYDISLSNCTVNADNLGYLYSTVIDNIGQELHLAIKKSSNFNDYKYNEWLRTLGRYISSLSDITRIKFNDIYISFEDPSVQTPTSRCDYIKNESGEIVGILIKYQPGTSEDQFNMIMNDYCDWGIFHEISHAYGYLNDITQSYSNFNSYGDEGLVNVRAMAAVQNCKDLKNKQFMLNGFRLGNYTHALSDAANAGNYYLNGLFDQLYIYDKYANSFVDGWAVIEKIMLGDKCELDNETLNTAIEFVKSSGGYTYGGNGSNSISFSNRTAIRFINVLYYLCKNHPKYGSDQKSFKKFLEAYVGIQIFSHYLTDFPDDVNNYAIKNVPYDVDGNNVLDEKDLKAIKDFANGKRTLTPEGVYQADYNKDGYVNVNDAIELEEMWF